MAGGRDARDRPANRVVSDRHPVPLASHACLRAAQPTP